MNNSQRVQTRLDNQVERCIGGCGFRANPKWNGYCSKCFELNKEALQAINPKTEDVTGSSNTPQVPIHIRGSSKVPQQVIKQVPQQVIKQVPQQVLKQDNKKPIKVGLKTPRSKLVLCSAISSPNNNAIADFFGDLNHIEKSSLNVTEELNTILNDLKRSHAQEIVDITSKFMDGFQLFIKQSNYEEIVNNFNDYFSHINHTIFSPKYSKNISLNLREKLFFALENFFFTHNYLSLFCIYFSIDNYLDRNLLRIMKSLNWILPENIESRLFLDKIEIRHALKICKDLLLNIDQVYTPREKLSLIVDVCKHLLAALQLSQGDAGSADDLIPSLIYAIIQASPPFLISNIKFIERFSFGNLITTGESAYYFTTILAAINYLQCITDKDLKTESSEHYDKMILDCISKDLYVEPISDAKNKEIFDILDSMNIFNKEINSLNDIRLKSLNDATILKQEITTFRQNLSEEVKFIINASSIAAATNNRKVSDQPAKKLFAVSTL